MWLMLLIGGGSMVWAYRGVAQESAIEQLAIPLGQTEKISLTSPFQIQLGKHFKYRAVSGGVEVTALQPGYGLIKNKQKVIGVHALTVKKMRTFQLLRKSLADQSPFMRVTLDHGEVILEGSILSYQQLSLLRDTCQGKECDYSNRLVVHKHQLPFLRQQIYREWLVAEEQLPEVIFEPHWLIRCSDKKCEESVRKKLSWAGVRSEVNERVLPFRSGIRVQLVMVEFKRSSFEQLGIRPPTELSAQILPEFALGSADIQASLLAQKGWGRMLANPSLIVRSGEQAEFRAGGEIPFRQLAFRTTTVTWKPYGVLIRVKAKSSFNERIHLDLECEVSSLDSSVQVDGMPGFKLHRLVTAFDLFKNHTVILTGFFQSDQLKSAQGIKGAMDIPILGSLFASEDYRNKESEFVIFLKPSIVEAF